MADKLTVEQKQELLRQKRSGAAKARAKFLKNHTERDLKPGLGKGLEPLPWCECHNRNPCPISEELGF